MSILLSSRSHHRVLWICHWLIRWARILYGIAMHYMIRCIVQWMTMYRHMRRVLYGSCPSLAVYCTIGSMYSVSQRICSWLEFKLGFRILRWKTFWAMDWKGFLAVQSGTQSSSAMRLPQTLGSGTQSSSATRLSRTLILSSSPMLSFSHHPHDNLVGTGLDFAMICSKFE